MNGGRKRDWSSLGEDSGSARAAVVNRTHRIVRDEAMRLREQRRHQRSLLAPLLICSALLLLICYAVWALMAGYDLTPTGVPDASDQMLLLLVWSLPVTTIILGMIWLRRRRGGNNWEGMP